MKLHFVSIEKELARILIQLGAELITNHWTDIIGVPLWLSVHWCRKIIDIETFSNAINMHI